MSEQLPTRVPWGRAFPDVVTHTTVPIRDADPGYIAAKSGNADAALQLARRLMSDDRVENLRDIITNSNPLLLPVVADEIAGFNAIPDAMAHVLASKLGLEVIAGKIVQTNKVGHTRARTFQRIITPATFSGPVSEGRFYVLVDDHVGLGGTLANLRGHLETKGGRVLAMTTLTESHHGRQIALREGTLTMLRARHGETLETFWQSHFGHGIDSLTEIEAQNLNRQESVAAVQDILAKAAIEARSRGLEPRSD